MRNRTRLDSIDEIAEIRASFATVTPGMKERLDSMSRLHATPAETAMQAAREELGQYFSPHVRQGIEVALGVYTTELTRQQEQGEQ